jgi:hypothetical protein
MLGCALAARRLCPEQHCQQQCKAWTRSEQRPIRRLRNGWLPSVKPRLLPEQIAQPHRRLFNPVHAWHPPSQVER